MNKVHQKFSKVKELDCLVWLNFKGLSSEVGHIADKFESQKDKSLIVKMSFFSNFKLLLIDDILNESSSSKVFKSKRNRLFSYVEF